MAKSISVRYLPHKNAWAKKYMQEVIVDAINRRKKTIRRRVTITSFTGGTKERRGVVLVMEEAPTEAKNG